MGRVHLWWIRRGSNSLPPPCHGGALPGELRTHNQPNYYTLKDFLGNIIFLVYHYAMKKSRKDIIQEIALNGLIAATYAVLTIVASPLYYGPIQFRFSEILVLFCF